MKFTFSLEVLLVHRKRLEDVAQRDWAEAQAKVEAAQRELKNFYSQIDDARIRSSEVEKQGGNQSAQLISIDEFIGGQAYRIEKQRIKIRELASEAERLQEILVEAVKETKTLMKLKERQLTEYKLHRRKKEAKQMDDVVVTRFKRAE